MDTMKTVVRTRCFGIPTSRNGNVTVRAVDPIDPMADDPTSLRRVSHMCYIRRMADVASRELRNNTRALLARVEAGESITITVDGRPVAFLEPIDRRPLVMSRDYFLREIVPNRADPGLLRELREMMPETTDDLPWR